MADKQCTYCGMTGHRASQCPRRPRESLIERHLVACVKAAGGEIRKVQWPGRVGAPDRYVMLPGRRAFWAEIKAPGEKPTTMQVREHNRMRRLGEIVHVVDSIAAVEELVG